jgi:hypothetical protein
VPYSNTVTLLDTEGGPVSTKVVARLWQLFTDQWGEHAHDIEEERTPEIDVRLDETQPTPFSFTSAATYAHKPVGLSLQDSNRIAPVDAFNRPGSPDTGWLFRSGAFQTALPSTSPIDLIAARDEIANADLPALFPTTPVTVDANTTITQITPTLADPTGTLGGGIDFALQGTWTGGVGFSYGGRLVPTPGTDVSEPNSESIIVEFLNENHQFLGGASPPNENQLWGALWDYTTNTLLPAVRSNLESHVAKRIAGAVGISLTGNLPRDVILSVRSVSPNSQRLQIRGVLGSFGDVVPKLRQLPGGGGGGGGGGITCPLPTLAFLGHPVSGLDVLRAVRDGSLASTETGRWATAAYYRFGTEVSSLLARNPRLAARAAALADELAGALRAGGALRSPQRQRCEYLLRDLAAVGSPELRAAIAQGLDAGVTRLL